MAKKPVQFRFEENFHTHLINISKETGNSASEIVRDAISLYIAIYERAKGGDVQFFIKSKKDNSTCEVLLPWLKY